MDSENEQERDMAQGANTALTEHPDPTTGFGQAAASSLEAVAPRDPQEEIVAALAGERYHDALGLCASHHGEALGRLCMALVGSRIEAGDLVQEPLLAAYEGFRGYRDEGTVKAWLSSIARRKCAHHLETRSRTEVDETFSNHSDEVLEGVYRFPLPPGAKIELPFTLVGDRAILAVATVSRVPRLVPADTVGWRRW